MCVQLLNVHIQVTYKMITIVLKMISIVLKMIIIVLKMITIVLKFHCLKILISYREKKALIPPDFPLISTVNLPLTFVQVMCAETNV